MRLFLSILSLGIVPLIFFIVNSRHNKKVEQQDKRPVNFVTTPSQVTKQFTNDLEQLATKKEKTPPTSPKIKVKESPKTQPDVTKMTDEDLYQKRIAFDHPLGPLLGQERYIPEDERDKETTYVERTVASVLDDGSILANDVIQYQGGHHGYAVGIFDRNGDKLTKPLFRVGNPRFENMIPFEFQPKQFVYFVFKQPSIYIYFNNGRNVTRIPNNIPYETSKASKTNQIIPVHFELSDRYFNIAFIGILDNGIRSYTYKLSAIEGATLTSEVISNNFANNTADRSKFTSEMVHNDLFTAQSNRLTAAHYSKTNQFLYVVDAKNNITCIPLEKLTNNLFRLYL